MRYFSRPTREEIAKSRAEFFERQRSSIRGGHSDEELEKIKSTVEQFRRQMEPGYYTPSFIRNWTHTDGN